MTARRSDLISSGSADRLGEEGEGGVTGGSHHFSRSEAKDKGCLGHCIKIP